MWNWPLVIIIALLVGLVSYHFAKEKGYNPIKCFSGGVVFVLAIASIVSGISFWNKKRKKF